MTKLNYNRPIYRKGKEVKKEEGNKPVICRIYLIVTFREKETVKSMGARWDVENKLWYVFNDNPHIKSLKKYIHPDDYEKCGIDPNQDLHQLLTSLKNSKYNINK
jgi:hypothetical protein